MSRVFVAEETALGATVVVKVLPPELAAGVSADRFRREIQLAARLQHPHIVPLLAAGRAGRAAVLHDAVRRGRVAARAARARAASCRSRGVRILRDVATALAYAHEHGVVHRDIKPDNVLLHRRHAVVTDFGVAKALSAATRSAGRRRSRHVGIALGTPAYMAPEQAAGGPARRSSRRHLRVRRAGVRAARRARAVRRANRRRR